jgi:hypothetical protein
MLYRMVGDKREAATRSSIETLSDRELEVLQPRPGPVDPADRRPPLSQRQDHRDLLRASEDEARSRVRPRARALRDAPIARRTVRHRAFPDPALADSLMHECRGPPMDGRPASRYPAARSGIPPSIRTCVGGSGSRDCGGPVRVRIPGPPPRTRGPHPTNPGRRQLERWRERFPPRHRRPALRDAARAFPRLVGIE